MDIINTDRCPHYRTRPPRTARIWAMVARIAALAFIGALLARAAAPGPDRVLLVVNDNSALSRAIGEYYALRRSIPSRNICHLKTSIGESIGRDEYTRQIERPIGEFLRRQGLEES